MTAVDIRRASSELAEVLARAEAGEEVELTRDGVPVVRLVPVAQEHAGERFLRARGMLKGQIQIGPDFEFTDEKIGEMYAEDIRNP